MSIYKSSQGERIVREWCDDQVAAGPWDTCRTIATCLGETHIASTGSGSKHVLWLPGTNFNAATTGRLAEQIDQGLRFHVADLPGQPGLSSGERLGKGRLEQYGAWVRDVVASLDTRAVVLCGHSLGGAVALAAEPSPSIAGLFLVNPAGLTRIRITPRLIAVSTRWLLRTTNDSAASLLQHMQHQDSRVAPELAEWLALVGRHTKQPGAPGPLPHAQLDRWRDQAWIGTGSADRFFPPSRLEQPAANRLNAVVHTIERAGHLVPDERPEDLAELLMQFVSARNP